jgi:hypothetical protein
MRRREGRGGLVEGDWVLKRPGRRGSRSQIFYFSVAFQSAVGERAGRETNGYAVTAYYSTAAFETSVKGKWLF